jgi:hypothetical protein
MVIINTHVKSACINALKHVQQLPFRTTILGQPLFDIFRFWLAYTTYVYLTVCGFSLLINVYIYSSFISKFLGTHICAVANDLKDNFRGSVHLKC